MLYSKLFGKSVKEAPKDEVSINAKLLLRGGFIDKLMAGSYTILPLGKRVQRKIERIIREELNKTGAQELLMPLLHPKAIWNETGRWDSAKEVMYQFEKDGREYTLSFTHEEIVMDLVRKHIDTYRDFPVKVYHFSTKFRNELRAKSGLLRGREFIMKDLYSLHASEDDFNSYYWEVAEAYKKVFERVGLKAHVVEAAGGVFTENTTHEFQVFHENGEDTVYYCGECDFAQNDEIAKVKDGDSCPKCTGTIKVTKAIEVGNIFPFGTVYSKKMNVQFTDNSGKKQFPYLGSYGIGITRLIGTIVETEHDERGIIWPAQIAPFTVHLVGLNLEDENVSKKANEVYNLLTTTYNLEVLFDDRVDTAAGAKFADADLIGIPHRLVVSKKTGDKVEYKRRDAKEAELLSLEQVIKKIGVKS